MNRTTCLLFETERVVPGQLTRLILEHNVVLIYAFCDIFGTYFDVKNVFPKP